MSGVRTGDRCSIPTSSSVHLAALAPELPWGGGGGEGAGVGVEAVVEGGGGTWLPWSCMVSSPSLAKASPAEEKISPTLFELLMPRLQLVHAKLEVLGVSRVMGGKKL